MITKRPNRLDLLIIADIQAHPGTSKSACIQRLMCNYQSYTYIRNRIQRLIILGHLSDSGDQYRCKLEVLKEIPAV